VIASAGNTGTQNLDVNDQGGTGTVILSGANTFGAIPAAGGNAGLTQIYHGLLEVANPLALQNSTLDYNAYGGSLVFASGLTNATLGGLQGSQNLSLANLAGVGVSLSVGGDDTATTYSGNLTDGGKGGSFSKLGLQTLTLTGTSGFTGTLTAGAGVLDLQGPLTCGLFNSSGNGGAQLVVDAGAMLTVTNYSTNVCAINAGSVGLLVQGGTASITGDVSVNPTGNDTAGLIDATGGTLSMNNLIISRSGTTYTSQPTTGDTGSGLYVNGGLVVVTNNVDMGVSTNGQAAIGSTVSVRIDSGTLVVGNVLTIALANLGRWSVVDVNGGNLFVPDTTTGVAVGGPVAGNADLLVQNGTATAGIITMGQAVLTNQTAFIGELCVVDVTGGALYVGSGGIVQAPSGSGYVSSQVQLGGGILGASNSWSSAVPFVTEGTYPSSFGTIQTADANGNAKNITLTGGISGAGALYVSGGNGVLTISGPETWTGGTLINQGTLAFVGQDSAAGFLQGTSGITNTAPGIVDVTGLPDQTLHIGDSTIHQVAQGLSGNGVINGNVFIGAVGTLAPGYPVGSVSGFLQIPINKKLTVASGGTVALNIDDQGSGGVNDSVSAASVAFQAGSTLVLNQGGNDLKAGDTFQLFNITGNNGLSTAANLTLNLPALSPDSVYAYVWDTSKLAVNGSVTLASVKAPPIILGSSLSAGVLTLTWTTQGMQLQTNSVNLANPNDWFTFPGSTSVTTESFTVDPTQKEVFYRLAPASN
jgi:autotransporter-associated beta strand protein